MQQIFINIPVSNLNKSVEFYLALGFTTHPLFTDENQKCMRWSESIYVMLQSKQFFNSYLQKPLVDALKYQTPSHTLPVESNQKVNEMIEKGLQAGGTEPVPALNEDFMFLRSIEDLDGYLWGIMHLDIDQFKLIKKVNQSSY